MNDTTKFERRKTIHQLGIKQLPPQLLEANDDLAVFTHTPPGTHKYICGVDPISSEAKSMFFEMEAKKISDEEFERECNNNPSVTDSKPLNDDLAGVPINMLEGNWYKDGKPLNVKEEIDSVMQEMRGMTVQEFYETCNVIPGQPIKPEAVLEQTSEPIYPLNEILANTQQILSMLQSITNILNNLSKPT